MTTSINITKRIRKRRRADGEIVEQPRFVVSFRDPHTGRRKQLFFERRKDADAKRGELLVAMGTGSYNSPSAMTVKDAMCQWLDDRLPKVRSATRECYEHGAKLVIQLIQPETGQPICLGAVKVTELSTAEIRRWHNAVREVHGHYSANRAMGFLKTALDLAAEDFGIRPPAMPKIDRVRGKAKKKILNADQIAMLIAAAKADQDRGVYIGTLFLTGMRIGEMLALQWGDVDFERNEILVRRVQEKDGTTVEATKTDAGMRAVPMGKTLREVLLAWKVRCPRLDGELLRVFPTPGKRQPWPLPRKGGGGALLYSNFRVQYWLPFLRKLGLPAVTPHSARHSYISTLQAGGIEVALVAKLAGHSNPAVTLGIYTQALRGSDAATDALERAYVQQV